MIPSIPTIPTYGRDAVAGPAVNVAYASVVLADSPAGLWRLGEAAGTNADDASPNNRDGTYVGGPTLGVGGALVGESDTAVSNFGPNVTPTKYVTLPASAVIGAGAAFTVEAWVKLAVGTTDANAFAYAEGSTGSATPLVAIGANSGNPRFFYRNDAAATEALTPAVLINDGNWYHLVGVRESGGTTRFYVNGSEAATGTFPAAPITLNTATIGARQATSFVNGFTASSVVDEVAVYATALGPSRVLAHYQAGIA